jgi:hypothetical protein
MEFAKDLGSAVGGTIVDDDDFAIGGKKILLKDAGNGLLDKRFVTVSANEYACERNFLGGQRAPPGGP